MDALELQRLADRHAAALPEVTVEHRTNPNWETYKVRGKVFMLMTDMPGHPVVTVKVDPDEGVVLREQFTEITAGYHTDKTHWVTATGGPEIDEALVSRLVVGSYQLVVDKLPKMARPVYGTS